MGFGETRFASSTKALKLLYIAEDLPTAITEAVVRDRFESKVVRELATSNIARWGFAKSQRTAV